MPWQEATTMSQRLEFVMLVLADRARGGRGFRELCRRFDVSAPTGHKWTGRYLEFGEAGLEDRSRRPHSSPGQTAEEMSRRVIDARREHPAWGGRKLRQYLVEKGVEDVPAPNTVTAIVRRAGMLDPKESEKHRAWERFERSEPNDLWQMDYKGHVAMGSHGARCHPLVVLDDHSRYCIGLRACGNERGETVVEELTGMFRIYGLPMQILTDNGPPWGVPGAVGFEHTWLTVWLLRLGTRVTHGRRMHPQTQGKTERFNRTLGVEPLSGPIEPSLLRYQSRFDAWRPVYNHQRPHDSLGLKVPASRYRVSERKFPETLPPVEYGPEDIVRRVQQGGVIDFRGREWTIGKAFVGEPVGLRATQKDGLFDVYFCNQRIEQIDVK